MAITKVVVNLPPDVSYDVRIGSELLENLGEYLRARQEVKKVLLITDSHVGALYLPRVKASLASQGYRVTEISIPSGEASKNINCVEEIWEAMAQEGFTRDSLVCALGGGVVGDLAGFVASTYMRGVEVVQVPTTLLAMVDSSVGGKTGINLSAGKNLVGAFKQPLYVCASTDTLSTLPEREWVCGCAEVAKTAVIDSDDFFFWLSENAAALARRDEKILTEAIARCVITKARVVAADTLEQKGIRECLNYGHTLGHAIEKVAGYGTFSHGVAVAEGMRFASRLGADVLGTSADFIAAQDELLDNLGLPSLSWAGEAEDISAAMRKDKKVRNDSLRFVLPQDVGVWQVVEVEDETLQKHVQAWVRSKS